MINTVIFDMDGVIVDTEPVHHYALNQHFNELGIEVSPQEYASFTGGSTRNVYQRLREKYHLAQNVETLVLRKREIFNQAFNEKKDLDLISGARKLIEDLYSSDFQLILGSSSAKVTIDRIFNRFKLFPYFRHIVSGEDFPKSKPDPAIFLEAVRVSGEPKKHCIVIEDSTNGVRAANAAGIFCVGYVSEHSLKQNLSSADFVIHDFSELNPEIIRNFTNG
ncbi:MAG: HAD family hydrolase [Flavobacteriaceae bacterium]|jgi:HAD superfamily hydrolase (TIGR01509 family)|nr:HAD family hydrolase [Flavobacteriaceae bacterium]